MQRTIRKLFVLALVLSQCLSLTACGNAMDDEHYLDEDIDVLVCIHAEDAAFYYDSEDQVLFDFVEYPTAIQGNPWESYQSIDFADRNDDGNSDVAMVFDENGNVTRMVWFWDADTEGFVFQSEEN